MALIRVNEEKQGSNTVILLGGGSYQSAFIDLPDTGFYLFQSPEPKPEDVLQVAEQLEREIEKNSLKRLTLAATTWGGPIAIQYAASFPKNVRRLVLLNARARLRQSAVERVVEKIEEFLPLGLPLRPLSKGFDPRPLLHRVRCPSFILSSDDFRDDALFLLSRIPNAWSEMLIEDSLAEKVSEFLNVPTKQPQKRAVSSDNF